MYASKMQRQGPVTRLCLMVGVCPRALRRARLAQFAAVAGCSAEVFGSTLAAALSWRERSSVLQGSIKTARNAFDSARPRARPF